MPDSLTNIGWSSFEGCSSLTEIIIPESVLKISDGLFAKCTSLIKVIFSNTLLSIGTKLFIYSFYLKYILVLIYIN